MTNLPSQGKTFYWGLSGQDGMGLWNFSSLNILAVHPNLKIVVFSVYIESIVRLVCRLWKYFYQL